MNTQPAAEPPPSSSSEKAFSNESSHFPNTEVPHDIFGHGTADLVLDIAGTTITRELPVQFRYEGAGLVGEKDAPLLLDPQCAFDLLDAQAIRESGGNAHSSTIADMTIAVSPTVRVM